MKLRERRSYCVYIMGSLSGTLYVGFTGNLHQRIFQHKFHQKEGFTKKYDVERLLYFASFDDVHKAIAREKQLKGWRREKKIALIQSRNPHWLDLAKEWYPWMEGGGAGKRPRLQHLDRPLRQLRRGWPHDHIFAVRRNRIARSFLPESPLHPSAAKEFSD